MTWDYQTIEQKYLLIHNTTTDQYIGWRAFKESGAEDAYLYEPTGFSGFNSVSTPWDEQPGSTAQDGWDCYVPLSGGASPVTIYYWVSVQDERITAMFKVGSVYPNMYLGSLDPFLTEDEYGYSQLILGCLTSKQPYTYSGTDYAGMTNPGSGTSPADFGPGILRRPNGAFAIVKNWHLVSGVPSVRDGNVNISPAANVYDPPSGDNGWYSIDSNINWRAMFTEAISIPSSQDALKRVDDLFILIPATLMSRPATYNRVFGNMRGVFSFNPDSIVSSEDQITIGTDVYRVFQNCNKTNRNFFFAVKED
jgi:hypothetical protein